MENRGLRWFLRNVLAIKAWIIIALAFLLPSFLLTCNTLVSKCLYAIIVMAVVWLTEVIPISVTALFPVFLFPMLGIATGKEVCAKYVNDTSILFLGGLIVAVAIEETGLHKRMALSIMRLVGGSPNMLLLGLMFPTWFLSMWISNTATASMMLPIITAVVDQLKSSETAKSTEEAIEMLEDPETNQLQTQQTKGDGTNGGLDQPALFSDPGGETAQLQTGHQSRKISDKNTREVKKLSKVFALSVAYAANVGGISTLVGTPPNLILQGTANQKFSAIEKDTESGITFANWMGFALPLSFIMLIISWLWLQILFIRCGCLHGENRRRSRIISKVVKEEFENLGRITFAEIMVLILFTILCFLWIFRDLPGIDGWSVAFQKGYVRDSTASILIACLLFIIPAERPNIFCWNKYYDQTGQYENPSFRPILTWKATVQKVPWGVIILLGGGFALAHASEKSGLSLWMSCKLQAINEFDPWVINLIICCIVAVSTEVTSNTATATLLLPIMFDLAVAGVMMNIIGIAVLTLAVNTWATSIFGLDQFPDIFTGMNYTYKACAEMC